ncbi:MAG: polymer-forming cytoskeletal protein [Patescibacteria group bacterium]
MKTKFIKILVFLALILLPFAGAKALDTKTGDSVYIAKDEIVSGNFYAAGNTITIDGTVSGDLIAAAQTITVNGRVEGDVIAAGQTINVNGEVGGNVRVAGNSLTLNGSVARNVNAFGANVILGNDAKIGWDVYAAGNSIEMRGTIDGSLAGQAGQTIVSGKVGKDVDLKLSPKNLSQGLVVSSGAIINGDLTYTAKKAANISSQASVSGQTKQITPQTTTRNWLAIWAWSKLFAIFAAIAVGLILVFILKNITPKILTNIKNQPLKTIIPGLILMFILPPIALVLCFTVIGIPLALIIMVWWLVMIYVTKIFTAILVGELILKKVSQKDNLHLFWSLVLGVFICWLLFAIPFIGWILGLIAVWLGWGGIYYFAVKNLKSN